MPAVSVASYAFLGCCSRSGSAFDITVWPPVEEPDVDDVAVVDPVTVEPAPNCPSSFEVCSAVVASVQRVGPLMEHTFWFDSRGSNDRQVPAGSWESSC